MTAPPSYRVKLAGPTFPDVKSDDILRLLNSGWLTNGSEVRAFEQGFADYLGAGEAVAVSSCTAALHIALTAHGIGSGDEVITSPMTFAATANVISQVGAQPVLADIAADSMNICPAALERAITPRTRAVIIVHFAGQPADMAAILALKRKYGFVLIQDAAHATEALYRGKSLASFGDSCCFSFYATKNLPLGEGGMLVTLDPAIAKRARALRSHGMSLDAYQRHDDQTPRWQHWDLEQPGFNYKMTELAGYLGQQQLRRLDDWHARRAALVDYYESRLAGLEGIALLPREPGNRHAHHLFVILLRRADLERDVFLAKLRRLGIEATVHYRAVHELSWYRRSFGWTAESFPRASEASRSCISLPLHPQMDESQVDLVFDALRSLLSEGLL